MRALALVLAFATATGLGCTNGEGTNDAPVPQPLPLAPAPRAVEEKGDVWEVVKVELAGAGQPSVFEVAGVEIRVKGEVVAVSQSGMFDHAYHVRTLGIDCRYCHKAGEPASTANAVGKTCWNCHQNLAITKAGVRVTPDNFAAIAGKERLTLRYVAKFDEKNPRHAEFVACDDQGRTHEQSPVYRALLKDEKTTRVLALSLQDRGPRPTEFKPVAAKPGVGETIVLHLKKK